MKDYIELFERLVEKMAKLSTWRFAALLFCMVFTVIFGILAWKLPEILAVILK